MPKRPSPRPPTALELALGQQKGQIAAIVRLAKQDGYELARQDAFRATMQGVEALQQWLDAREP